MKQTYIGKNLLIALIFMQFVILSCKENKPKEEAAMLPKDVIKTGSGEIVVIPVTHASFILKGAGKTVYVDPVGDKAQYSAYPDPDLILYTDIHGDHLNAGLLREIKGKKSVIAGPKSVEEKIKGISVINNGETKTVAGIKISAIPMYNTTRERMSFHAKGRGNGYVLAIDDKKIYISADTEDIPEMRALKNIDAAFICMNLPYTMTEDQAASAVLEFKPKIVYPYHYRGAEKKFSDINKFKKLVSVDKNIDVRFLKWY